MNESSMDECVTSSNNEEKQTVAFKKPILIGKIGRLPRKTVVVQNSSKHEPNVEAPVAKDDTSAEQEAVQDEIASSNSKEPVSKDTASNEPQTKEQNIPLSYIEPNWSGIPNSTVDYSFEVLKSGVIIDKINLMTKSYFVFGRLAGCDVIMAHPTISRYHAVIQYKAVTSDDRPAGFYIYDLGSTHGTFLNKNRIKPKMYVRIQVGHMLKLGCSTRTYLLLGPDDDTESETELTITELKAKRAEELRQREENELREAQEREEKLKKEAEKGIDWGMGEDADEETDLAINPYAETNNETLYIEDPKKALRGFMEREGLELHYEVTERGLGQFLCSVSLPLDDPRGRPIVAEALVKGKKKEAVVQCALEACRILDRHGVLRQATHESRKRKTKNWEDNDYYDSDEDTFLDRTGTIERKREKRMKAKEQQQPETYQSLCAKEEKLIEQIRLVEKQLAQAQLAGSSKHSTDSDDVDSLDHFMNELSTTKPDKYTVGKLKSELTTLRKEHADVVRLVNIARPAYLPPLVPQQTTSTSGTTDSTASTSTSTAATKPVKALPMYGKRLKVKVMLPSREIPTSDSTDTQAEEEEDEIDEPAATPQEEAIQEADNASCKEFMKDLEIKVSLCDEKALASLDNKVKQKISKTVTKLRRIAEEEERIVVDEKRLAVQKKKIYEQVNKTDAKDIEKHIKLTNALNKMTGEFCMIGDRKLRIVDKINKLADDINSIAIEIRAASKDQHEKAVNRMKEFVEKSHKQQTEIYSELENLGSAVTDQKVIEKLKELYEWLSNQKIKMLENLEKLKNVKLTEDSKLLEDIIEFEMKSDKFITTILEEIRKIRSLNEQNNKTDEPRNISTMNNEECLDAKLQNEECLETKLQKEDTIKRNTLKKVKHNEASTSENRLSDDETERKRKKENTRQSVIDEPGSSRLNEDSNEEEDDEETEKRRRKKNQRRIMQRQERAEAEKKKQYEEDAKKEDYNMWVPPKDQSGDGRTWLNDKLGY